MSTTRASAGDKPRVSAYERAAKMLVEWCAFANVDEAINEGLREDFIVAVARAITEAEVDAVRACTDIHEAPQVAPHGRLPATADQVSRVRLMASGAETWDLSVRDCNALESVLEDRDRLARELKAVRRKAREHEERRDADVVAERQRADAAEKRAAELLGHAQRLQARWDAECEAHADALSEERNTRDILDMERHALEKADKRVGELEVALRNLLPWSACMQAPDTDAHKEYWRVKQAAIAALALAHAPAGASGYTPEQIERMRRHNEEEATFNGESVNLDSRSKEKP